MTDMIVRRLLFPVIFLVLGLHMTSGLASAQVPFACSGEVLLVQNVDAQLTEIDQSVSPFNFILVGPPSGIEYNNMGFRRTDGLLYAVELSPGGNLQIIQIDSTGTVFGLGRPAGLPTGLRFDAGDISADGTTMYITRVNQDLYRLDLTSVPVLPPVTSVQITGAKGFVFDWAAHPINGLLYGGDSTHGQLAVLDPVTGVRTDFNIAGLPSGTAFGGAWFDALGSLFLYQNDGFIFQIDLAGPTIVNIQPGPGSTRNDVAACIDPNQEIAALELTKTGALDLGGDGIANPGDLINYTFTVTNTGNVNLTDVSVSDPILSSIDCSGVTTPPQIAGLAVGASESCNGSYSITQADIDTGQRDNIATATGQDPSGSPISDQDSHSEPIPTPPQLPIPFTCAGDGYIVQNLDAQLARVDQSVAPFNFILVGEPMGHEVNNLGFRSTDGLMYGVELNPQGNVQIIQIDSTGSVFGLGRPSGLPTGTRFDSGDVSSDGSTMLITANNQALYRVDLTSVPVLPEVTSVPITGSRGLVFDWAFNPSDDLLYGGDSTHGQLAVLDPATGIRADVGLAGLPAGTPFGGAWFNDFGNLILYQNAGTIFEVDVNGPTILATETGPGSTRNDGTVCPVATAGGIDLVKDGSLDDGGDGATPGDVIDYTFEVTNTGNVPLTNVTVTDPLVSPIACPQTTLAPGEPMTCTGTYAITQADIDAGVRDNTATVTGDDPNGDPVTDNGDHSEPLSGIPAIDLVKDGSLDDGGDGATPGDLINYTFVVTNIGTLTLNNVTVTDPLVSPIACPQTTLVPGESMACTGSYPISQADIDAGVRDNTATATGDDPNGDPVTDDDSHSESLSAPPLIDLVKDGSLDDGGDGATPGDLINYTFVVTNIGNVLLTNVTVTDPLVSPIACPQTTLAPGESMTCFGSYPITQADIDAGVRDNTATAIGDDPNGDPVSDDDDHSEPLNGIPAIDLVKDGSLDDNGNGATPGDLINYTFVVTNIGNVPLTNVTVTDPLVSPIACPQTTLVPAESMTCIGSYAIAQADIDAGVRDNTATATGDDPNGDTVTDDDSHSEPIAQIPDINLIKDGLLDVGDDGVANVGDVIEYTFVLTNTGDVTVSAASITDPMVPTITCPSGNPIPSLEPGASETCTGIYAITQADIDAGEKVNTANVDSEQTESVSDTHTEPLGKPKEKKDKVTGTDKPVTDPVNSLTGAFTLDVTDLRIPGRGLDFIWSRSYDSNIIYPKHWELGTAWSSPYFQRLLKVDGQDIDYVGGNGRMDRYSYIDGIRWGNAAHYYKALELAASENEFIMIADGEMRHVFHDFSTTSPGRLKRIEDRFGNAITFVYSGSALTRIEDSYGRPIDLTYNTDGHIVAVTDFAGRTISYDYYMQGDSDGAAGQLKSVKAPEVTGTSTGNDFSGVDRKTTTYSYMATAQDPLLQNNLTTVIDPKGQAYLQNTYAATTDPEDFLFSRVVEQRYGNERFQLHYQQINESVGTEIATQLVIVNDRRGIITETRLNDKGNPVSNRIYTGFADPGLPTTLTDNRPSGKLRPSDPDFFETVTAYDPEGKPLPSTNPRGNVTETEYNTAATERHGENNPTRIVQKVGSVGGDVTELVTEVTYEDNYQLRKTDTDARGNMTTHFYDYEEAILGDLNGDGATDGDQGLLVRTEFQPVTLGLAASGGPQLIAEIFQYNEFAQLIRQVDGKGHVTTYEYYPENDPDGDGQDIIPGRDSSTGGYLKQMTVDPGGLNLITSYQYDPVGNVIATTDPRGHTTTYEFNALNQIVRQLSPQMNLFADDAGAVYEMAYLYDANDNVVETWYEHENSQNDAIADTPGFSQPNFFETRFEYDVLDNMTAKIEEVGMVPNLSYSSVRMEYEYDPSENRVLVRHPNGDEDTTLYDERDLLFQTIIASNGSEPSTTQLNYDFNDNLQQRINPNPNNIENFVYDGFDRLIRHEIIGSRTTTLYQYDDNSNIVDTLVRGPGDDSLTIVDLSHIETRYDELDRAYETIEYLFKHADGSGLQGGALTEAVTQVEYDKDNRVVRTINPNNHETTMSYDNADRLVTTTDAVGNAQQNFYDDGQGDVLNVSKVVTTEVNPSGPPDIFTLLYDYDELNRLRRTEDDLQNVTDFALDAHGRTAVRTDAEGNQNKNQFDGLGRLYIEERQVETGGFITLTKQWDERSRLTASIDGESRLTQFAYDKHNRLITRTNADLTTRQYTWDTENNLVEWLRENEERIEHSYDDANRLTEKRYHAPGAPMPTIVDHYTYNGFNALTSLQEVGGHGASYQYESRGLMLQCTQSIVGSAPKTFVMDYNAVANPTEMNYPGGRQVVFGNYTDIELLGRIASSGTTIDYQYSGYGRVKNRVYSNGFELQVGFDAIKRVSTFDHVHGGVTQAGFTEQYDRVHNRRAETFTDTPGGQNHARVFDLDKYYRTTGFIRSLDPADLPNALNDFTTIIPADGQVHEWIAYDDANNINTVELDGAPHTLTNNVMNETEQFSTLRTNLQYDDNGRIVSYEEGGDSYTLVWNLRDQLLGVERNAAPVAEYEYYPDGMRAKKILDGVDEQFYGVGMSVHQVYLNSFLTKEFVFAGMDQPLVMFSDVDSNAGTGFGGREAYFYHANPRGDVYGLSDEFGNVAERYEYSLFGETVMMTGNYALLGGSVCENPFLFGGAYHDEEVGLYQMRFRYYDPLLRKFLTRDPVEDDSLLNLYTGFENSPGVRVDPMGLSEVRRSGEGEVKASSFREMMNAARSRKDEIVLAGSVLEDARSAYLPRIRNKFREIIAERTANYKCTKSECQKGAKTQETPVYNWSEQFVFGGGFFSRMETVDILEAISSFGSGRLFNEVEDAVSISEMLVGRGALSELSLTLGTAAVKCNGFSILTKACEKAQGGGACCRCRYSAVGWGKCVIEDIFDFKSSENRGWLYNSLADLASIGMTQFSDPIVKGEFKFDDITVGGSCGER